uniref:DUF1893 domain-containing protein n=1 Tax=Strongyloides venezuelensis TaxID=75913 RepID=A0A0K0FR63_STRVS
MDMVENVRIQEKLVFEANDSPGTYSSIFSGRIAKEYIERLLNHHLFHCIKDSFHGKSSRSCRSCTATIKKFTRIVEEKSSVKRRTNPSLKFLEIYDYNLNDRFVL